MFYLSFIEGTPPPPTKTFQPLLVYCAFIKHSCKQHFRAMTDILLKVKKNECTVGYMLVNIVTFIRWTNLFIGFSLHPLISPNSHFIVFVLASAPNLPFLFCIPVSS